MSWSGVPQLPQWVGENNSDSENFGQGCSGGNVVARKPLCGGRVMEFVNRGGNEVVLLLWQTTEFCGPHFAVASTGGATTLPSPLAVEWLHSQWQHEGQQQDEERNGGGFISGYVRF